MIEVEPAGFETFSRSTGLMTCSASDQTTVGGDDSWRNTHYWCAAAGTGTTQSGRRTSTRRFAGWHGGIVDAFRDQPEYHLLTGGQFIHHHKEFVTYPVEITSDHPIVAGLETFEVHSEQYYLHADPGIEVLATTEFLPDPDRPEIGTSTMPVTWLRRHGAGRVFVTTIGHRMADLDLPAVDEMIRRGLLWATR